jgi:hypothetical protein
VIGSADVLPVSVFVARTISPGLRLAMDAAIPVARGRRGPDPSAGSPGSVSGEITLAPLRQLAVPLIISYSWKSSRFQ